MEPESVVRFAPPQAGEDDIYMAHLMNREAMFVSEEEDAYPAFLIGYVTALVDTGVLNPARVPSMIAAMARAERDRAAL